jgi:hypothetical protein
MANVQQNPNGLVKTLVADGERESYYWGCPECMVPERWDCHETIGCYDCFAVFQEAFDPSEATPYTTCKHTPLDVKWFRNQEKFTFRNLYVGSGCVATRCIVCNGRLCVDYCPKKVKALQQEQADEED